jgi:predicted esterase
MTFLTAFVLVLSAGAQAADDPHPELPALPGAEAKKLRKAYTAALAANDPADWKAALGLVGALEKEYSRASLLAVLAEGPDVPLGMPKARKVGKKKEDLEDFGRVVSGYAFEHDGRVYRYAVDVPRSFDGKDPRPLLVDPGHGSGAQMDARGKADFMPFFRGQAKAAEGADWLVARTEIVEQVGAGGLRGELPEDEVARVFAAFRRDVVTRFAVDLDRIVVAGLSQTGFWSWYLGRELADRLAGIVPMGAVTWGVEPALENLSTLRTFVLHGANDPVCPVAQPRRTTERMQALGLPVRYVELPDGAHDVGVWSRMHEGLAWIAAEPRAHAPASVVKVAGTRANPWAHWLRLDALEKEGDGEANSPPTARAEARIEGQTITVTSAGVAELSLWLTAELLDLAQPVTVTWNGATVHAGPVERSARTAAAAALERCDWRILPESVLELR